MTAPGSSQPGQPGTPQGGGGDEARGSQNPGSGSASPSPGGVVGGQPGSDALTPGGPASTNDGQPEGQGNPYDANALPADVTTLDTTTLDTTTLDTTTLPLHEAVDPQRRASLLREATDKLYGDRVGADKVGGDKIGGDKYVTIHDGRERVRLPRLGSALADMVRRAFVTPAEWSRVVTERNGQRIVVLRADPSQGKSAAAIRLLQTPPDRPIYHLDRTIGLTTLAATLESVARSNDPLPRGAGFLLQEPSEWDTTEGWMLQQVEAALDPIDAQLVLTIDRSASVADQDIRSYIVDLGPAPDAHQVFESHLTWRLGDARLSAQVRVNPEVAALASEVLVADTPLQIAANLATMVSQALDGGVVDVDRVRQRMSQVAAEDIDIWFDGLPDLPTRCLAIALAVLDGMPYENVVHAAELLAERLDGPPQVVLGADDPMLHPWRDPFRRCRSEVLRLLRATICKGIGRGMFGSTPVETMEYRPESFPRQVLEHAWRRFGLHRELLGWLRDLAGNSNEEIRARAGTALGLLSTFAFDFVWIHVLRQMAQDKHNFRNREVVAYALRVPASEPALRPLVDAVVTGLFRNSGLPFGQATAARVYGVSLGPLGAGEALAALDRLATIDNRHIAASIGDSLADLVMQDEQRNPVQVFGKVSSWQNDRRRTIVGEFVFLHLARWLITEYTIKNDNEPVARTGTWPTLLLLADQRPELRVGLLSMWRSVINSGKLPDPVEHTLAHWAQLAEDDADVRTALSRMLAAVASASDRTHLLVLRQVKGWRAPDTLQPKPRTAYAVENALRPRTDAQ
ncbi:MAG: hypothetical protein JXA67_09480 [Micromonosporaceae bacterium]|nr:hypothetical protein [Micromonosporaceae bacterium]